MKFILPAAAVIILVLGVGAALMIKQQKATAMKEVRDQAKLIESQISVVRAAEKVRELGQYFQQIGDILQRFGSRRQ